MRLWALAMYVVQVHAVDASSTGPRTRPEGPSATADVMGAQEATPARAVWAGGWWWCTVGVLAVLRRQEGVMVLTLVPEKLVWGLRVLMGWVLG